MKPMPGSAALLALTLASAGAAAATYTFGGTLGGNGYGNSMASGNLTVTGLSNTGAGASLQTAYVGRYGDTLGITNRDTGDDGTIGASPEPQHAADNSGHTDMFLLSFSGGAVDLGAVGLGYARERKGRSDCGGSGSVSIGGKAYCKRADIAVLAYTGTGFFNPVGRTYGDLLSNDWSLVGGYGDVPDGSTQAVNAQHTNSSFWIVAAWSSLFGSGDSRIDAFKLAGISAAPCVPGKVGCASASAGVPEPGTVALAAAALWGLLRRRRRAAG